MSRPRSLALRLLKDHVPETPSFRSPSFKTPSASTTHVLTPCISLARLIMISSYFSLQKLVIKGAGRRDGLIRMKQTKGDQQRTTTNMMTKMQKRGASPSSISLLFLFHIQFLAPTFSHSFSSLYIFKGWLFSRAPRLPISWFCCQTQSEIGSQHHTGFLMDDGLRCGRLADDVSSILQSFFFFSPSVMLFTWRQFFRWADDLTCLFVHEAMTLENSDDDLDNEHGPG